MERRGVLRWTFGALLAATLLPPWSGSSARAAETVRVNGSGSALELMKPLAEVYQKRHPEVRVEVEKPLGSSGAIKALLAGALDLAVSSKVLTPEQRAQGATSQEYGQTPLAIVVQRDVPAANVTTAELEAMYTGKRTTWPNGERVRVVLRPQSDVDTAILRGLSPGMDAAIDAAQAHPGMVTAVTDPESNVAVSKMPGGLGASGLTGVLLGKDSLRVLALNGVKPTPSTLADRTYPLAKDIRFVTTSRTSRAAKEFLAFAYSTEGRDIAAKAGVWVAAGASDR